MTKLKNQFEDVWGDRKKRIALLFVTGGIATIGLIPYITPQPDDNNNRNLTAIQKVFGPLDTEQILERRDLDGIAEAYETLSKIERRGMDKTENIEFESLLGEIEELRDQLSSTQDEFTRLKKAQKVADQQRIQQASLKSNNSIRNTGGTNITEEQRRFGEQRTTPTEVVNTQANQSTVSQPPQFGIRTVNDMADVMMMNNGNIINLSQPSAVNSSTDNTSPEQKQIELANKEKALDEKIANNTISEEATGYTIHIPTTSLLTGVLLSGMQAPTSIGAKREPLPATIRFKHDALLPNNFRVDIRDCQGTVSAIGSLSDSRAYMRLEKIVCIDEDGLIAEVSAKGYATGGNGQAGIPGRLVSRNGEVLRGSVWSGLFSGIAQGISPQRVIGVDVVNENSGGFQVPDLGSIGASAALNGVSGSMDRMSEYYIKMVEEIWPTVDVPAMQEVTFFLTDPLKLTFN